MALESSFPLVGVSLHALGGFAAASFYIPYKKVSGWPWENAWILGGLFSWIIAPSVVAAIVCPESWRIIIESPPNVVFKVWLLGFLWGIGGLTFGLAMRYLGIALGYALALGLCAFFGTLLPPLVAGEMGAVLGSTSGQLVMLGLLACLAGIAMSGRAGWDRERELDDESPARRSSSRFTKGSLVAVGAGVMSACMAFAFIVGRPISGLAVAQGVPPVWQNVPVLIVALFGGFCLNFLWCVGLIIHRRQLGLFFGKEAGRNCFWCMLAGVTWYMQFLFYGMGTTKMGAYEFSSWTLHMSTIIIFSGLWGFALKEWQGTGRSTRAWIAAGFVSLVGSTIVVGWGSGLANQ